MNAPARNDFASGKAGEEADQKQLNPNDTSTENQRAIILAALRTGPKDTVTLRADFGVLMPAPRIHELRHKYGYDIDTVNVIRVTDDGVKHFRVAKYVLHPPCDLFSEVTP
ncbi:MAG: helix-turn-helix domain-containing protein [Pseudomonadota bacterium]